MGSIKQHLCSVFCKVGDSKMRLQWRDNWQQKILSPGDDFRSGGRNARQIRNQQVQEKNRERERRWHFVRLHVSNTVFHTGWFYFLIRYIFYFSGHYDFWICKILLYTKNMYCIDDIGNSKIATFIGMSWKQRLNLLTVLCSPWWGMTLWGNFLFEPIRGDETQEH